MAFDEIQFPPQISYGAVGGPEFSTDVIPMSSGYEQRNQNWANGRLGWNVATGLKSTADVQTLLAFFYNRKGKARSFRFKDWSDFAVTAGAIATSDGIQNVYQLSKTYSDGLSSYIRSIQKPVSGSVVMYLNGVAVPGTWAVDTVTGLVTFSSAGNVVNISSITESSSTATVTCATNHGLLAGSKFTIAGSTVSGYNGTWTALSSGLTSSIVEFTAGSSGLGSDSAGTVTGLAPLPGQVITADFQFDAPVRFDTDKCDVTMENFDLNIWRNIPVIEVRLDSTGNG